jgi:hypothetical protein
MSEINEKSSSGKGGYLAAIIVLLLGLAFMAYLWSSKNGQLNECMNENKTLNSDMEGMNEMLSGYLGNMSNDLKKDFKNMLETYDALLEKDKTQSDSINAQKQRIQELIDQVDRGKMSAHQLFLAKKEIETLRKIMRGYIYQIDSLNTLNLQLTNNLDSTSRVLTSTKTERDQYQKDSEEKGEQLKKGAKLNAYGFTSKGLKEKLNSSMTETDRAKSTVQIMSSFSLSKNPITTAGKKTVYMQIVDPSGNTMQQSSGNVISTDKGQVGYSDKKVIDYQNESLDMSIYYSLRGQEAQKGNYKVNIYCEGHLIGSDSFTLK